ncbi:MAG: class I SAM-dependent methyltransferase [Planctomycetota bacterium]|jgi:SAM-dependent methyltransferase
MVGPGETGFWVEAQAHEIESWQEMGHAHRGYLARRGAVLDAWLRFWGTPNQRRILEIGGAGLPLVDFVRGYEERHAVDPLMDEYDRIFSEAQRGENILRRPARAEELPYPAQHFDTVIMLNVLDHTQDPERVLAEVRRVLRRDTGLLFLSCDTYSRFWLTLRAVRVVVRGKRRNDILHPHHYTEPSLLRQLARRFEPLEIRSCYGDPFAGEARARRPYPFGGIRNRLKREGRVYVIARPAP